MLYHKATCPITLMVRVAQSQASTANETRACFSTTPTSSVEKEGVWIMSEGCVSYECVLL